MGLFCFSPDNFQFDFRTNFLIGHYPLRCCGNGYFPLRTILLHRYGPFSADTDKLSHLRFHNRLGEPVSIHVETFGTEHQVTEFIENFIRNNYDLTPAGIIEKLDLLNVDYNKVSSGGHFGKGGLPWEEKKAFGLLRRLDEVLYLPGLAD